MIDRRRLLQRLGVAILAAPSVGVGLFGRLLGLAKVVSGSAGAAAHTGGAKRTFAESMLLTVRASIWHGGGDPGCIMVGSFSKKPKIAIV